MQTIAIVGCGFLGSLFTEEFLKLSYAGELPHRFLFVDGDEWEPRNAANQNVPLFTAMTGAAKAETMRALALQYQHQAETHVGRVTADNIAQILGTADVIIDAVDNVATRQLLYIYGIQRAIPVLHVGIDATMGTGQIEWSYHGPRGAHDTFSLSPALLLGKPAPPDPESGVTPPCELVRMRAAGWHASYAAAISLALYYGFDPLGHLFNDAPTHGYLTEWQTTPHTYAPLNATWTRLEAAQDVEGPTCAQATA